MKIMTITGDTTAFEKLVDLALSMAKGFTADDPQEMNMELGLVKILGDIGDEDLKLHDIYTLSNKRLFKSESDSTGLDERVPEAINQYQTPLVVPDLSNPDASLAVWKGTDF